MLLLQSLDRVHAEAIADEFAAQPFRPASVLMEADLAPLPPPVARYVRASGAVGRPRPENMRVEFDALMRRKPGQRPMVSTAVQYTFFGRPARLFLMRARMFGLSTRALHLYRGDEATFQVRVASLVNMVNLVGDEISAAETVTVLNDLCLMAPGALVDPRLAWEPVDERSASVTFTNGRHKVGATLLFNERDELVDFWSYDRPDSSTGRFVALRWNTPVSEYRRIGGIRIATVGKAIYAYPDGPFAYGEFHIRSLAYDVPPPPVPALSSVNRAPKRVTGSEPFLRGDV